MIETGKEVLEIEAKAILRSIDNLGSNFDKAVDILFNTKGRVIVSGMGKSGIIGKKISATMTSTGTPSIFLHPAEALHGDIGIINDDDSILALSTSGETSELLRLLVFIKRIGVKIVSLVGNPGSTLAASSDVFLDCQIEEEAGPVKLVPTVSTTLMLAMGDALSVALIRKNKFNEDQFRNYHPGGEIGKMMLKVSNCMRSGDDLPTGYPDDLMEDIIRTIDEKKLGTIVIIDRDKTIKGIITDGDLRRAFLQGVDFHSLKASEFMTMKPAAIGMGNLAVEALNIMESRKITSLVVEEDGKLKGILHLHDLWRTEMI